MPAEGLPTSPTVYFHSPTSPACSSPLPLLLLVSALAPPWLDPRADPAVLFAPVVEAAVVAVVAAVTAAEEEEEDEEEEEEEEEAAAWPADPGDGNSAATSRCKLRINCEVFRCSSSLSSSLPASIRATASFRTCALALLNTPPGAEATAVFGAACCCCCCCFALSAALVCVAPSEMLRAAMSRAPLWISSAVSDSHCCASSTSVMTMHIPVLHKGIRCE